MNYRAKPGSRTGSVSVPASKSYAHRLLIGFALSRDGGRIECEGISEDVKATIECLKALGAEITISEDRYIEVKPADRTAGPADTVSAPVSLHCGESGSTLRFLLPVVGALGAKATFHMEGRLPDRPFRELAEELAGHGMTIQRCDSTISCEGKLWSGDYTIPGNISSQYVTGLLMALPLLEGDSTLTVTGEIQSADYIAITEDVLQSMKIAFHKEGSGGSPVKYGIPGSQTYNPQPFEAVERDWSGAAFFACMGALSGKGITLRDMPSDSVQGDRRILDILKDFGADITVSERDGADSGRDITVRRGHLEPQEIDVSQIPDILPEICIVAACCEGTTTITGAERLRFKESDRLKSMAGLLRELDVNVKETRTGLIINGTGKLTGGYGDPFGDHRIAMAAAVAATAATGDITITDAECVAKSYPGFWEDFDRLEIE